MWKGKLLILVSFVISTTSGSEDFSYEDVISKSTDLTPEDVYSAPVQHNSVPSYVPVGPQQYEEPPPPKNIVEFTEVTVENIKNLLFGHDKEAYVPTFDNRFYQHNQCLLKLRGYCMSVGDINDAMLAAYSKLNKWYPLKNPNSNTWNIADISSVGEYLTEVSRLLSIKYRCSRQEIWSALPLIDTSKTMIREICPKPMAKFECTNSEYRRMDSWCNNAKHPDWGSSMGPFAWFATADYEDGVGSPKQGYGGAPLPNPRLVSSVIHRGPDFRDAAITTLFIFFGQYLDHDMIFSNIPIDPKTNAPVSHCCTAKGDEKHPACYEIPIDGNDYLYGRFGKRCESFLRLMPAVKYGCPLGAKNAINRPSAFLDMNLIYGSDEGTSKELRAHKDGKLKVDRPFQRYGLKDMLTLQKKNPESGCIRPHKNAFCFFGGDNRVSENPGMVVITTLFMRQHNHYAEELHKLNPHWDDEKLFQTTRKIMIAVLQHLSYNEFLPILLGKKVMEDFGLVSKYGSYKGYDAAENPSILSEFAGAAFRFGHTIVPRHFELYDRNHRFVVAHKMSSVLRKPFSMHFPGVLDQYGFGLMNQIGYASDSYVTSELRDHLFQKFDEVIGHDLVSFNIQRGREMGLKGFMECRKICGLPVAYDWNELYYLSIFPNATISRLRSVYSYVSDIDLWTGGISERPLKDALIGPTFACIVATQFKKVKYGDQYWYENTEYYGGLRQDQVAEINKYSMARLMCDYLDHAESVQRWPFIYYDYETNPRISCNTNALPRLNLALWKEAPTYKPY